MMKLTIIDFQQHTQGQGKLVAIEEGKEIPFDIKRIYYIYGCSTGERRGFHAHKNLKQLIFAIHGQCKVDFEDGKNKETILLDHPCKAIYIDRPLWREIYDFSSDCVLMVLASEIYLESDYIRDYEEFLCYVGRR